MPTLDLALQQALQNALAHHQAGRLHDAEQLYRQILAQYPAHADVWHLLGVIAHQVGQNDHAAELIRRALVLKPNYPEAHSNLGNVLQAKGQIHDAIAAFREAIALNPHYSDPHFNLGNALKSIGQIDEAIAAYRQAITLSPQSPQAYCNLGNALQSQGRLDEAIALYQQAIALKPDYADAHTNLGNALKELGQFDEAIAAYRQAITDNPNYPDAHNNLGNVLKDLGLLDEAIAAYRKALALKPNLAEAHGNLAFILHYHPGYDAPAIADELQRWNQQHAQPLQHFIQHHLNDRSPGRTLKIGYVSNDLRLHSVAFFLLPLLQAHDKQRFHVTCYPVGIQADHMTARLRACSDDWHSLAGLSDAKAAERIRQDHIDILVDLSGHTAGNRLLLFARKPAPVQVTYLGFPGTTGLRTIDYRFTDNFADPPSAGDSPDTEELIRLPDTAWCFFPLSGSPPVTQLPALRNGSITFGSFNNLAKVTPPTLNLWSTLLLQMPAARLVLKSVAFNSPQTVRRFTQLFAERGIAATRIDLIAHQPSQLRHLQCYDLIDIALDTFPYHGTTTTCEALWMGVPVITLAGQRHASRVGISLLSNLGLPDLVAHSPEHFVEIASRLAGELPRLAQLRATLRQRMQESPLMDAPCFVRNVETAYRDIWTIWCRRQASQSNGDILPSV